LLSAEQNDLRVKALREIETAASELKYKEPRYSEHLEQRRAAEAEPDWRV
jgi:hypothetical protein